MAELFKTSAPVNATLADWRPKKNAQDETRVRLDFEVPISSEEILNLLPKNLQRVANFVSKAENGVPKLGLPQVDYQATVECFPTGGHTRPEITFSNERIYGLKIWRPTPKDGSTNELYLDFSITARAEGPQGDQIVQWALHNLRSTVFILTHEVQGVLPGMETPAPEPKTSKRGKDAASGEPIQ